MCGPKRRRQYAAGPGAVLTLGSRAAACSRCTSGVPRTTSCSMLFIQHQSGTTHKMSLPKLHQPNSITQKQHLADVFATLSKPPGTRRSGGGSLAGGSCRAPGRLLGRPCRHNVAAGPCTAWRQTLPRDRDAEPVAAEPVAAEAAPAGSGRGTGDFATVPEVPTGTVGALGVSVPSRTASVSSGLPRIVFSVVASPARSTHRAPSWARPGSTRRCAHQRTRALILPWSSRTALAAPPPRHVACGPSPCCHCCVFGRTRSCAVEVGPGSGLYCSRGRRVQIHNILWWESDTRTA